VTLAIAIGLLALGVLLIVAEVLFPSFGALSIAAAACIIGSVVAAFGVSENTGYNFLIAVGLLVPTAIVLGLKVFPKTPIGKYMTVRGLSFESKAATDERDLALVGHEGEVESKLRPAGMARIDGRRVDVISRGEMIGVGERVRVVAVEGNRVVVARIAEAEPKNEATEEPQGTS
jgi:membrane-bound ClpP family serine protease